MNEATAAMRGKHVLLVEDEYFIAQEMKEAFEASGAVVVGPVADPDDALGLIANDGPIDGAVLDINLQGEMSYSVADALRQRGVPFVFATGYDRSHIPASFSDVTLCEKPVRPNAVGAALFGRPPSTAAGPFAD